MSRPLSGPVRSPRGVAPTLLVPALLILVLSPAPAVLASAHPHPGAFHGRAAGAFGAAPGTVQVPTPLPIRSYFKMVVDDAHQHVFLSSPDDGVVTVMNFDGSIDTTLTGLTEPEGMAIDAATHTLYVAENAAQAVQAFDTTTLTAGTTFALGECPTDLALTAGRLWFSYFCREGGTVEGIGSLDLGSSTVVTDDGALGDCCIGLLAVDPATPTVLYSGIVSCPIVLSKFDVSAAAPTLLDSYTESGCTPYGSMNGLTTVPGHDQLVTATDEPTYGATWKTSDMTPDTVHYASAGQAVAVAATSDGSYVATGAGNSDAGSTGIDILVSAQGSDTAWSGFASDDGGASGIQTAGLAFSGNASKLFVLTRDMGTWGLVFNVLDRPTAPGSFFTSLSIGPNGVLTGQPVTFSGTLTLSDGASAAGKTLHLLRTNPDYSVTTLPDVVTDGSGNFTFTESLSEAGLYTYTVIWDGDTDHTGTRGQQSIQVTQSVLPKGLLTISASSSGVPFQGSVTVTAFLQKPLHPGNRAVTIWAVPATGGPTSVSGTLNGLRKFSHVFKLARTTNFHATWPGDGGHQQTNSGTKKVTAGSVSKQALSGFYSVSGAYHLYHYSTQCVNTHNTGCPHDIGTVTPNNQGGQVCFSWQEYFSGAWHNEGSLCGPLDLGSQAGLILYYTGPNIIGINTRIHVHFNGTGWNTASTSGWVYLRVTN